MDRFLINFMNRWRGGGPKIYNINLINYLFENNIKAKNTLKPESDIFKLINSKGLNGHGFADIKTSLHGI